MEQLEIFKDIRVSTNTVTITPESMTATLEVTNGTLRATLSWSIGTATGENLRQIHMNETTTTDHSAARHMYELAILIDQVWSGLEELWAEARLMMTMESLAKVEQWAQAVTFGWDCFENVPK